MYKPSELRDFLSFHGIHPKKGLSQNFLIDGNIIRKIVKTAQVKPRDLVLEIGPGPGSLTQELLKNEADVIAVEKDAILAKALERFKNENSNLEIYCDDILNFPIEETLKTRLKIGQKAKVIANLPYHLTSPIIIRLANMHEIISELILMVQDEVGQRISAKPGTHQYGSLTVFLNFYTNAEYAFKVSRNCFFPAPKVDSAIIKLNLKPPLLVSNIEKFFKMTRTSFEHRRKMLRSSLRDLYAPEMIMEGLNEIKKSPQARPEELSVQDFIALFECLQKFATDEHR